MLEGLLEYERAVGAAPEVATARRRGEEYLLGRGLFRRRSTGEVANPEFLELAFPPRYHYDGTDRVEISGGDETVVERKVKLPLRWLKDFVEVQAYQSRLSRSQ